jgi:membrane fusion protein, multidrug efflux system
MMHRFHGQRAWTVILGAALVLAAGCTRPSAPPSELPPAPVAVAVAQIKTVPVQLRAIGNVRAYETVAIRPRVNGEIKEKHFNEGDFVKKGAKLFTIDPLPYKTVLEEAKALEQRDRAIHKGAEAALKRGLELSRPIALAAEELEKLRTEVARARATLTASEAAVKTADLQYGYTTIYSPIDGLTGKLLITPGNVVTANGAAPLVVINQIWPISVVFAVPEHQLREIQRERKRQGGVLPVEAHIRNEEQVPRGELTFNDNEVDTLTGTVQLKANFGNEDQLLWPGEFVEIVVTLSQREKSVTVPTSAVQEGQNGPFVFVVKADSTAEMRPVQVAFTHQGEAIIAKGLAANETVVTDGHLRVAPGSKLAVKGAAAADKKP